MVRQSGDVPNQGSPLMGQRSEFLDQVLGCSAGTVQSTGLHRGSAGCHRCRHRSDFRDRWCLWFCSCRCCKCNRQMLWQLCRLGGCRHCHRNARYGRSLQCGWCYSWGSVSGFGTAFMEVSSHVAVDHTITGAHLVSCLLTGHIPQWQGSRFYRVCHTMQWVDQHTVAPVLCCIYQPVIWWLLSMCWSAHKLVWLMGHCCVSWPEWLFWVGIGTIFSAGDGSLVSMGVAQSASRASCGSAPLYLAHWSACLTDLMHALANPLDCR